MPLLRPRLHELYFIWDIVHFWILQSQMLCPPTKSIQCVYLLVLIGVDVGKEVRGEEGGGGVVLPAQHPLRREHPFPLQKQDMRRGVYFSFPCTISSATYGPQTSSPQGYADSYLTRYCTYLRRKSRLNLLACDRTAK